MMSTADLKVTIFCERRLNTIAAMAAIALLVVGYSQSSLAEKSGPRTFPSAVEASKALYQAVKTQDEQGVEAILGAGKEVTSSNDDAEDKLERERFVQKYQEMHRLVREPDGSTVLYIGAENWPFPIPLESKNGAWYFDSDAGMQEILFRTIGENEVTAIHVCHTLAEMKDGKETEATGDDAESKYAESLASGRSAGADATATQASPFHGYYFRLVTTNSPSATGGQKTGGVTLVAYPADYRSSGVMTFIVTSKGSVYEKDLGPKTESVAKDLKCGPDSSWHTADESK